MSRGGTRLVLLGTAGGPLPSPLRSGIAQAVVVAGQVHLVDCGSGVTRQLRRAKLLKDLHAVYLTHLHSDHDCDYFNVFLLGWPVLQWNPPVRVYGPGPAGGLPDVAERPPDGSGIPVVNPANPTPGLTDVTQAHIAAHAYDLNIRMRESGRADLTTLIDMREIPLPAGAHTALSRAGTVTAPIVVVEDSRLRVTATLVDHGPVFPSFAFRFDSDDGAVVISGDTAPSAALIAFAGGADVLVHEVFDDSSQDGDSDEGWEAQQRQHHLVSSHTPLSDVGRIAAEAGVRRLVLTHFIPGDDALPDEHWVRGVTGFDGEVLPGHDLMELVL